MIKTLSKLEIERNFLNLLWGIYKMPSGHLTFIIGKVLNAFPIRSETRQACLLLILVFHTGLEVFAMAIRQEIKIKGTILEK